MVELTLALALAYIRSSICAQRTHTHTFVHTYFERNEKAGGWCKFSVLRWHKARWEVFHNDQPTEPLNTVPSPPLPFYVLTTNLILFVQYIYIWCIWRMGWLRPFDSIPQLFQRHINCVLRPFGRSVLTPHCARYKANIIEMALGRRQQTAKCYTLHAISSWLCVGSLLSHCCHVAMRSNAQCM